MERVLLSCSFLCRREQNVVVRLQRFAGVVQVLTSVWLADSMLLLLSSPLMGTSGMVPNFCLEMSEEEWRRRTGGTGSSFWKRPRGAGTLSSHVTRLCGQTGGVKKSDLSSEEAGDPVPEVRLTGAAQEPEAPAQILSENHKL